MGVSLVHNITNFQNFPHDILAEIFKYCDLRDVGTCQTLSRKMTKIAVDYLWKPIAIRLKVDSLDNSPPANPNQSKRIFFTVKKHIVDLKKTIKNYPKDTIPCDVQSLINSSLPPYEADVILLNQFIHDHDIVIVWETLESHIIGWKFRGFGNIWVSSQKIRSKACKFFLECQSTHSHRSFSTPLDLRFLRLKTLPEEVCMLYGVEELRLLGNYLSTLPKSVGNLSNLKGISLFGNNIKYLPKEIGGLTSLKEFELAYNQLTTLPNEFGKLIALEYFSCYENHLIALPSTIGNLTHLVRLSLEGNQLEEIPEEIGDLSLLTFLDLSSNRLQRIPKTTSNLTCLKHLILCNNLLEEIPEELRALTQLETLRLENNQLTKISQRITNLPSLNILTLENNPFNK